MLFPFMVFRMFVTVHLSASMLDGTKTVLWYSKQPELQTSYLLKPRRRPNTTLTNHMFPHFLSIKVLKNF